MLARYLFFATCLASTFCNPSFGRASTRQWNGSFISRKQSSLLPKPLERSIKSIDTGLFWPQAASNEVAMLPQMSWVTVWNVRCSLLNNYNGSFRLIKCLKASVFYLGDQFASVSCIFRPLPINSYDFCCRVLFWINWIQTPLLNFYFRLECHVIGNPTPEVMWLMDGQIIHPEDGEATFEQDVATLLLEDAMSEDSGKYECVATNSAGEARSSCHVQVLGE